MVIVDVMHGDFTVDGRSWIGGTKWDDRRDWKLEDGKRSENEHEKGEKIERRLVKEEERERKLKLEGYTIGSTRASVFSVTGKEFLR